MIGFLLLLASAVLLTAGAELFAENASAAGRRLGVTALAVGLVLAGAEPGEMVTAVFASAGHPGQRSDGSQVVQAAVSAVTGFQRPQAKHYSYRGI